MIVFSYLFCLKGFNHNFKTTEASSTSLLRNASKCQVFTGRVIAHWLRALLENLVSIPSSLVVLVFLIGAVAYPTL